ncbi:MAG: hypothetical protein RMK18_02455 [Armatimonadota bacterium]|nr:hypothetical protein [Armatimonadota bacterium]MCX7777606.1 hypothetical protein [Armatimonadota bacterium]MDW8024716.1 hypothetical protein [Armatimonadota bacterium]
MARAPYRLRGFAPFAEVERNKPINDLIGEMLSLLSKGLLKLAIKLIQALPSPIAICAVGRAIGIIAYYIVHRWRVRALQNLNLVFGDKLSIQRKLEIAKKNFKHLGCLVCEMGWDSVRHGIPLHSWVRFHGLKHIDEALSIGNGVIIVTAHLGNWALLCRVLRQIGYKVHPVIRMPSNEAAREALIMLMRQYDVSWIPTPPNTEAVKNCLRLLRRGEIVCLLVDRRAGGLMLDFLGLPALTAVGAATLHIRTGAPLLPVFILRSGYRHDVFVLPKMKFEFAGDYESTVRLITQAINDLLSEWILRYPEQWLWIHRRWRL